MPVCLPSLAKTQTMVVGPVKNHDEILASDGAHYKLAGVQLPAATIKTAKRNDSRLARRAHRALEELILSETLEVWALSNKINRYGSIVAHMFVPASSSRNKSRWVQAELLSRGLARVFPDQGDDGCLAELLALEKKAREEAKGLWKDPFYKVIQADNLRDLHQAVGRLVLVEGKVTSVAKRRTKTYMNFSNDWRRDFTVTIAPRIHKKFTQKGVNLDKLVGKRVRVRGWLDRRNGPSINVRHPAQLEILNE